MAKVQVPANVDVSDEIYLRLAGFTASDDEWEFSGGPDASQSAFVVYAKHKDGRSGTIVIDGREFCRIAKAAIKAISEGE